jgi:broad specificity phosphatase PhoE
MKLYLIRHGQSERNAAHLLSGRSLTTPLTATGVRQARQIGHLLSGVSPEKIVSSPAQRASETATVALETANITQPITTDNDLLERSQGSFEGRPRVDILKGSGAVARLWHFFKDGEDFALPGGESLNDVKKHLRRWLSKTAAELPAESVVFVFSHELAIKCLLASLFGWSKLRIYATNIDNASVTILSRGANGWKVTAQNQKDHL